MRRWFIVSCGLAISVTTSCVSIRTTEPPPPRLLLPQANAYVGSIFKADSLRPTFTWAPPAIGVYEHYQFQISYDSSFAIGVIEHSTSATSFTVTNPLPVSTSKPVGTRYYWRVRACVSTDECYSYSPARRLNMGRSNRDFNGDGYADVAIGAPQVTTSPAQPGRVSIYNGGTSFNAIVDATLLGSANGSFFGVSVASAGDVNGDGYADLIVGANGIDSAGGTGGHAYLYFGSPIGLITSAAVDLRGAGGAFGRTVASAGDVNGDGFDDVLVGMPEYPLSARVDLYLGGSGAFDVVRDATYISTSSDDGFGYAISAGDVNGDGYSDALIGARNHSTVNLPSDLAGRAYLYLGTAAPRSISTGVARITGSPGNSLGAAVSLSGDLDQDGFSDPVIGSPGGAAGRVSIFLGSREPSFESPVSVVGGAPSYGSALATDSDVDGDGRPELLVGAPSEAAEIAGGGRAYVYFKVPGAGPPVSVVLTTLGENANLGFAIAATGDVNGDGFGDVVVGANGHNNATGAALLFNGTSTGLDPVSNWVTGGSFVGDRYGNSVAAAATPSSPASRSCRAAPNGASNRPAARCARRSPR